VAETTKRKVLTLHKVSR